MEGPEWTAGYIITIIFRVRTVLPVPLLESCPSYECHRVDHVSRVIEDPGHSARSEELEICMAVHLVTIGPDDVA